MNAPKTTPRHALSIATTGGEMSVSVNDFPVLWTNHAKPIRCLIPVDLYLHSGDNMIEIRISPYDAGSGMTYEASLVRKQDGEKNADAKHICVNRVLSDDTSPAFERSKQHSTQKSRLRQDTLEADPQGEIIIGNILFATDQLKLLCSRTIGMSPPNAKWTWQSRAEKLQRSDRVRSELIGEYQKLHSMLKAKDIASLRNVFSEKIEDFAKTFDISADEAWRAQGIEKVALNDRLTLDDFETDAYELHLFGNGHLATLGDSELDGPLCFYDSEDSLEHYVNIFFAKFDNQWRIVR